MENTSVPFLVLGAGLSGLATAWYLTEAGARVHVIEAGPRPGGLVQTIHLPEGLVETAARAFTWSDRVEALFAAARLTPIHPQDTSKRRFIWRGTRARRWPLTPWESVQTAGRVAVSWAGRSMRPRERETVAAWGTRVLGPAATRWLIAPALQGIYASPPDVLSAPAVFGPGRRIRGRLAAPEDGMGAMADALHAQLVSRGATFEFNTPAVRLDPSVPTAICTNAPAAARLLAPHAAKLADAIGRIRMVSLFPVTAFYIPRADDLRGFGVLFPRGAGVDALGVLFNADIFPGRSPVRSETWIYGDLDPARLPSSNAGARARVAADRRAFCGRDDEPIALHAADAPSLLPVYDAAVLGAQSALSTLPPWLGVTGNYLGKLGVSGLLEVAAETATRLTRS